MQQKKYCQNLNKRYLKFWHHLLVIPAPIFTGINSSRNPGCSLCGFFWIPAFAGMTGFVSFSSPTEIKSILIIISQRNIRGAPSKIDRIPGRHSSGRLYKPDPRAWTIKSVIGLSVSIPSLNSYSGNL